MTPFTVGALRACVVNALCVIGLLSLAGCAPQPTATPTPSPTPRPAPTPTPTAVTLQDALGFRGVQSWLSAEGVYHIMGEVVNQSENALQQVRVTGRLADGLGQTVAEGYDEIDIAGLPPGAAAGFDVVLYGERLLASFSYELRASGAGVDPAARGSTGQVRAVGVMYPEPDGSVRVAGTVTNSGSVRLARAAVLITLLGDAGRVVGVGAATVPGPLDAGESGAFARVFLQEELGGAPMDVRLAAEGAPAAALNAR